MRRLPTPHFERGRGGERPRGVILHTTAGSFGSAAGWFADPESGVSAHYLVGLDGEVAQLVSEADTARHAGRVRDPTASLVSGGDPNRYTIGIEFEDGGDPAGVQRPDAQYRAGARLLRGIEARWGIPLDREHVIGHREVFTAKDCPGNLDLDRLVDEARSLPRLVCLLPARNAERDLPEWLDSVAAFADAVVALDDGSTDATRELLERHPLVVRVLANPPREGYAGWDDATNRNQLLQAAADLEPDWVMQLDADERIDAEDAAALRELVERDALPGCAYGFRHFRAWGGHLHDPRFTLVYRLFSHARGQRFGGEWLHFVPVPEQIGREAWVPTNLRIRHLGTADEERLAERRRKYEEADPEGLHATGFGHLEDDVVPERMEAWPQRPPGLGALEPDVEHGEPVSPCVVCLLPARNAEADLAGWLESAARFADAVVALDDGSTDSTREMLERHPLVARVLANPVRQGYAGWDDATNRNRLLEAAGELEPDWIMQLDADERIDAEDAAALRAFLAREAAPGAAYTFKVFRMLGPDAYDQAGLWVARLFAWEPGQRFPEERLHFVPVPTSIPAERWVKTTFRIQHLASLTEERRQARFAKYEEADPERAFQRDYRNLLAAPGAARRWQPRPPGFPPLADPRGTGEVLDLDVLELDGPILSAVVISRNDEARIERTVRSVVEQEVPVPFEVVVVTSGTDRTAEIVRERFPGVTLVELEGVALPGRARNAGVRAARGEYVSFPGSHTELPPGSLAARVRAHELGHSMVTGSMLNGTKTTAGWASYFLDHSTSLPGRPSMRLAGPPAHCSYRRDLLLEIGGFPEDMRAGEDTVVNRELFRRGHGAYRSQEVRLFHHSRCRTPRKLVSHHFERGKAYGRILREDRREGRIRRARLARVVVRYLPDRLGRTRRNVSQWAAPELRACWRSSYPLVVAGAVAAWCGMCAELVRLSARA